MLNAAFFSGNRQRLYKQLAPNGVVVLTAYNKLQRSHDMDYPFEQEANFWYLTGIDHADWRLIADVDSGKEWLVAPQLNMMQELFDGSLSAQEATQLSGIEGIISKREGARLLRELTAQKEHIFTLKPTSTRWYGFVANPAQKTLMRQLDTAKVQDIRLQIARMRGIKQPVELKAMQEAIDITIAGINELRRVLPDLQYEYEAEAVYAAACRRLGAEGQAWHPIMAAGANATQIHYIKNGSPLKKNGWLLLDVGARKHGYVADISRSIPLGTPTDRQRAVYEAMMRVQRAGINLLKPGQEVRKYLELVDEHMSEELKQLGLIANSKDMRKYFPHAIGHGLGIDAHDPLGRPEVFAENMVLTVEPGIYIPEEQLGLRVEDDILITADGPKNLSGALPSELADLTA